jgi:hypothetical protein
MLSLQAALTATWGAAATSYVDLSPLFQLIDGAPAHLTRINCKVVLTVTPHSSNATPGALLFDAINRLVLRDIKTNVMIDLSGHQLRTFMKVVQGWRYDDPADLVADSGSQDVVIEFSIPYHGGDGGVLGFPKYDDCIQPMDRIRQTNLEVVWGIAALGTDQGTITAGTAYFTFDAVPRPSVIQGVDIRYLRQSHADSQQLDVSLKGQAFHTVAVTMDDRDHSDLTVVTIKDYNVLHLVGGYQLLQAWNSESGHSVGQMETITTGEFMPILFQQRPGNVLGLIQFSGRRALVDTANTIGEELELGTAQLFSTRELAAEMLGTNGTVYEGQRSYRPMYARGNRGGHMGAKKLALLDSLLAQKFGQ